MLLLSVLKPTNNRFIVAGVVLGIHIDFKTKKFFSWRRKPHPSVDRPLSADIPLFLRIGRYQTSLTLVQDTQQSQNRLQK